MTADVGHSYLGRTGRSHKLYRRALATMPAGATRSLNSWPPHPLYLTHGRGSRVTDVDGNEYVDLLNNYTALVLGHADPEVVEAVSAAAARGTSFSFSTPQESELAELLCARVPSLERVRFAGSGTEAVMFALRLARAHTGRSRIAKMEGGFHGTHDDVAVSVRPSPGSWGPAHAPASTADMAGLPDGCPDRVLVLPFNDVASTTALLRRHHRDLAAVIVEPILGVGGMLPATGEYLAALRALCTELGIVLIFDEVITLRVSPGGAQAAYGVRPDLTVMGKVIGGGLPIGAYGGRDDLMSQLEPQGGTDVYDARSGGPRLYQGGTFTGNPCSLAAGLVTLRRLTPRVQNELAAKGDQLRGALARRIADGGLAAAVTGHSSLFNIHVGVTDVTGFRDVRRVDAAAQQALFLDLLTEGFIIAPRGMGAVSTATDRADIDAFVDAVIAALTRLAAP
ncbi:aspartate aminotransferase family protein [Actinomadura kijaniata]|uniref:aspartate aminotransferase family protein n=1 Tax=Actinomadura kijaniata TaxID=46161 RepID=UPI000833734A|nr:aspartate aminotransferase family protein [Actinomadura kijaniata]